MYQVSTITDFKKEKDMSINVIILRGLPGTGKTSIANQMNGVVCSADEFMVCSDGNYAFNPERLAECHNKCFEKFVAVLNIGATPIVANTNTERWEMSRYIDYCSENGLTYTILDLYDAGLTDEELVKRCVHGVPLDGMKRMRERYER